MTYLDAYGVERWSSLFELPDPALRCGWAGHGWPRDEDLPITERPGWGNVVDEVRLDCPCGRVRVDVFDPKNGVLLHRSYRGGWGPAPGAAADRPAFRLEEKRRHRERRAGIPAVTRRRQRAGPR